MDTIVDIGTFVPILYILVKHTEIQWKSVGWSIYTRIVEILVKTGFMRLYHMSNNRCKQMVSKYRKRAQVDEL